MAFVLLLRWNSEAWNVPKVNKKKKPYRILENTKIYASLNKERDGEYATHFSQAIEHS